MKTFLPYHLRRAAEQPRPTLTPLEKFWLTEETRWRHKPGPVLAKARQTAKATARLLWQAWVDLVERVDEWRETRHRK